jgi:excisionase family DNA binding protein
MNETTMTARPTGDGSNKAHSSPDNAPEDLGKGTLEPDFYTPGEMAALLRVPLRTLEKWTLKRRLPVVKVGRLNRFPRVEIQKRLLSGSLLR